MKTRAYESQRKRKWNPLRMPARLTRSDLVRAFSGPSITKEETKSIVNRYMGDSPVVPAWSYASVRGVFGIKAARIWARKLRHRRPGVYRDAESGRWLHPAVQTAYDFGKTPDTLNLVDVFKASGSKTT